MSFDPHWDNVALLIQGGGPQDSTDLVEAAGAEITGVGNNPMAYDATFLRWGERMLAQKLFTSSYRYNLAAVLGAQFTFEGWFVFQGSGTRYVFHNRDGADTDLQFTLYWFGGSIYLNVGGTNRFNASMPQGFLRLTYDGTDWRLQINDEVVRTYNDPGRVFSDNVVTLFGNAPSNSAPFSGWASEIRVTAGVARVAEPMPDGPFPTQGPPVIYNGPLQDPRLLAWSQNARISAGALLGEPAVRVQQQGALVAVPSPLQVPVVWGFSDFAPAVGGQQLRYVMRITGDPYLEVPISSWQATLQIDRQTYLQCVVPAVTKYASDIAARRGLSDFVIYRVTRLSGLALESEMARAPLSSISTSRGPYRHTTVLSGYSQAFSGAPGRPVTPLQDISSISESGSGAIRVRCGIDWFLRPGQQCTTGDLTFEVAYINYYSTSEGQSYMDVGTR